MQNKMPGLTITPDHHARAIQYLVDSLLISAERIGGIGVDTSERRERWNIPANPSMLVHELAAQMLLSLAIGLDRGEIIPVLPQEEKL